MAQSLDMLSWALFDTRLGKGALSYVPDGLVRLGGYTGIDGERTKTRLLPLAGFVVSNLVP